MRVWSWSGPNLPTSPLMYRMSSREMPTSSSGGSQPGPTPRGAKGMWPVRPGRRPTPGDAPFGEADDADLAQHLAADAQAHAEAGVL